MIRKLWAQAVTPKVHYTLGNITNKGQADVAARVNEMKDKATGIVDSLKTIDETPEDANSGTPGSIYGKVPGLRGTEAACLINDNGASVKLDVDGGELSYSKSGGKENIHTKHSITGSLALGDWGPDTLYTEEWAVLDGSKVSYKKIEYWGD